MFRKRKAHEDGARWPHRYVGPTTPWGLLAGTPCRCEGSIGGGLAIRTPDGRRWAVGDAEVQGYVGPRGRKSRPGKRARRRAREATASNGGPPA